MGVDLDRFWRLTPHTLSLIAKGHNVALKQRIEHENVMAHLQGIYFRDALVSTVGNMFSGKTSKKYDYPEKPYDLNLDGKKEEREQESQLELFKSQLNIAMNNFSQGHSKEQG